MADNESQPSEVEAEVKEFGNGAHVTLPQSLIGETVTVTVDDDTGPKLGESPSMDDLHDLFNYGSREDLSVNKKGGFPYAKEFVYEPDPRLKITMELYREDQGHHLDVLETGRVIFFALPEEKSHLADEDGNTPFEEQKAYVHDEVEPIIGSPSPGYGDWYDVSVQWSGTEIFSTRYTPRSADEGFLYIPYSTHSSTEAYFESMELALAAFISRYSREDYQTYYDALNLSDDDWESIPNKGDRGGMTHEEVREIGTEYPLF